MGRASRTIARAALLAALGGCRNSAPPVEEFLLAPVERPTSHARAEADGASPAPLPALRFEPLVARGFLDRREICWREGDVRAGPYHYRRWGEPPAEAVTRQLVLLLRARGRFEQVDASAHAAGPFSLTGELLALHEECDAEGRDPHGVAAVELVLERLDARLHGPPQRRIFLAQRRVAAADDSMEALVAAISAALAEVLDELAAQVEEAAAHAAS